VTFLVALRPSLGQVLSRYTWGFTLDRNVCFQISSSNWVVWRVLQHTSALFLDAPRVLLFCQVSETTKGTTREKDISSKVLRNICVFWCSEFSAYKCDFLGCSKAFATSANFIAHKRIHTGEKRMLIACNCGVCILTLLRFQRTNVIFLDAPGHFLIYAVSEFIWGLIPERNVRFSDSLQVSISPYFPRYLAYKCDIHECTKAFIDSSNLKRHKQTHIKRPRILVCDNLVGSDTHFVAFVGRECSLGHCWSTCAPMLHQGWGWRLLIFLGPTVPVCSLTWI